MYKMQSKSNLNSSKKKVKLSINNQNKELKKMKLFKKTT